MGERRPNQTSSQLALDLDLPPHFGREDFLATPCNEAALATIEAWPQWPDRLLFLVGPTGAGKTHLATIWAERAGAKIVGVEDLAGADLRTLASRALVIDDADRIGAGEAALFHCLNLARENQTSLVITARQRPELWGLKTPDLLSRLRLAPAVELGAPDEALLKAVLVKLFCDRQLIVDAQVIDALALHLDRSLDLARRIVALLDREALASGRKVTRAMVRTLLDRVDFGDEENGRP
jgi:chromosomal replication initiation ATPase DnaA